MSAAKESRIKTEIKTLGIIAGGGALPERLLRSCDQQGIESFVIALEGQTDMKALKGCQHMVSRFGAAGTMISTLKSKNIKDIVMIGSVRRPGLKELCPDLKTAAFFAKMGFKALGDNNLLTAIKAELEKEGFKIHAVQEFVQDILAEKGVLGSYQPQKDVLLDIEKGVAVSQEIGRMDIGQAVVVQQGIVLGVEGAEGTAELIRRCAALQRKGKGAVLVKTCKPQQDKALDLPTIGPDTIRQCGAAGFSGIVIHAGNSLLLDPDQVAKLADQYKIFVTAIEV